MGPRERGEYKKPRGGFLLLYIPGGRKRGRREEEKREDSRTEKEPAIPKERREAWGEHAGREKNRRYTAQRSSRRRDTLNARGEEERVPTVTRRDKEREKRAQREEHDGIEERNRAEEEEPEADKIKESR